MANKYCNLISSALIKDDFNNINLGFDAVEADINDVKADLNNLSFTGSEHDALVTAALVDEEGEDFGPEGTATYLDGRLGKWEQKIIAHLEDSEYYVTEFGAVGDGITDDAAAIQAAIDAAVTAGGGIVYFPAGTYLIGTTLSWTGDNIILLGAGKDVTIIRDHANLGANRLIYLQGTALDYIQNVTVEGITFRNGTASDAEYTLGKDAIRVEYVDGLNIRNCKFTEVQGAFCVVLKYSKNIKIKDNEFYRWTYSAISILIECENIEIENNKLDTATSLTQANVYAIATGYEQLEEGDFFVKNLWIRNNKIYNNPRWEAIDTHGGENIWIENNYAENCKMGIMCGIVTGIVGNPVLKNVNIIGNTLIQGTGEDGMCGIIVQGSDDGVIRAEGINIHRNKITGFGGTGDSNHGTIQLSIVNRFSVQNNEIKEYAQFGVNLYYWVMNGTIKNNKFGNARGGYVPSYISAICIGRSFGGGYNVTIENNVSEIDDLAKAPGQLIYAFVPFISTQIRGNSANHVLTALYQNYGYLPVEKSSQPTTNLTQKYGDVILTDTGKPGWYVSAPQIGYGSLYTDVIVTVDITSGSNVATINTNQAGDYRCLPEGMNITIAGAGAGGADLNARIIKNEKTTIMLDTNAETTVTNANLTYQTLTLAAV